MEFFDIAFWKDFVANVTATLLGVAVGIPDIVILRENFHAWKQSALEGNLRNAQKYVGDLNLASKSLSRLKNIRRLINIEVYISATVGMLLPYSDAIFLPLSLLLKKVEEKEIKNLGAMGVKVV